MFAWVTQYVVYILGVVIALLLLLCGAQTVRITLLKSQLTAAVAETDKQGIQLQTQNAAITQLVQEGEAHATRVRDAELRAAKESTVNRQLLKDIADNFVPQDCDGSAIWAGRQAKKLKEMWE